MTSQAQERAVDLLSAGSLGIGVKMTLAEYNVYMEAATLTIGFIAGLFALFFHIRRWWRGRKQSK